MTFLMYQYLEKLIILKLKRSSFRPSVSDLLFREEEVDVRRYTEDVGGARWPGLT